MLYSYNMSNDDDLDAVFKALANPARRRLLDALKDGPRTTGQLCEIEDGLDRCTVMQHLKTLEAADLILVRREGRERWNHLNAEPIKAELITARLQEVRDAGVCVAGALSPQRTQQFWRTVVDAGVDLFVIRGTTVSAEHVSGCLLYTSPSPRDS